MGNGTLIPFFGKRTITRDLIINLAGIVSLVIIMSGVVIYHYLSRQEIHKLTVEADLHTNLCTKIMEMPLWNLDYLTLDSMMLSYFSLDVISSMTLYEKDRTVLRELRKSSIPLRDTLFRSNQIEHSKQLIGFIEIVFNAYSVKNVKQTIIVFIIILTLAVSVFIILMTSIFLREILATALVKLSSGISYIAAGNYSEKISPVKQQDLNEIITGVNALSDTIAARESEIMHINKDLEHRIEERTRQLRDAQSDLTEKAHKAGMADIATSVIHNVGNVLTSLITSGYELTSTLARSKISGLVNVSTMLKSQKEKIVEFFTADPRGVKLIDYIILLSSELQEENSRLRSQVKRIADKAENIKEIIVAQQNYALLSTYTEPMKLETVIEDALEILSASIQKYMVSIEKHFIPVPMVAIQKVKMLHIFINLIKNAIEAVQSLPIEKRRIVLFIDRDEKNVYCRIIDTGIGIPKEHLEKIFNHGFTTKQSGHGFGLHSCANYMTELGGKMWAESDGAGKGTTFILCLPIQEVER